MLARGGQTGSPVTSQWAEYLEDLAEVVLARLQRLDEFGTVFDFSDALQELRAIRTVVEGLLDQDPRLVPDSIGTAVDTHLRSVVDAVHERQAFLNAPGAPERHEAIVATIVAERHWFAEQVVPYLWRGDAALESDRAALSTRRREVDTLAGDIRALLQTLQSQSGAVAASTLTAHYSKQARDHANLARLYLLASIISIAATVTVGVALLDSIPVADASDPAAWINFFRALATHGFLIGVFVYGTRFVLQQHAINKHLQVANEQRRNTLEIFPLIVAASTTDFAKDRVSILLAAAATEPFPSGYLGQPEEDGTRDALAYVRLLIDRQS
jgi:hypothetical protein